MKWNVLLARPGNKLFSRQIQIGELLISSHIRLATFERHTFAIPPFEFRLLLARLGFELLDFLGHFLAPFAVFLGFVFHFECLLKGLEGFLLLTHRE